jgi:hypothetical protein
MAEKKEYPRKMPLAPVDDATSAPPKTGGGKVLPKAPSKSSRTPPTSDELERRYDKLRQKDLNDASRVGKPTGYKKGGSIDGCALRGKTRGKMV